MEAVTRSSREHLMMPAKETIEHIGITINGCGGAVVFMGQVAAGSLSFDVAKRILRALEGGAMKRTRLAIAASLNYNVCIKYIRMLEVLGWVETRSVDESEDVSITEMGRHQCAKLLDSATVTAALAEIRNSQVASSGTSMRPAPRPSARERRIEKPAKTHPHSRELRHIMLVDDEPDILITFQSYLVQEGYDVQVFSDPYGALREFAARPSFYHLVILDIRMSDLNGLQLYQSLKVMNPSVKVFFVTAVDAAKEICSVVQGITAGDILKKPVDKETFLTKVSQTIQ